MDPVETLRRRARGKTRKELADELGVSRQMLWFLLTGKRRFTAETLDRLGIERIERVTYRQKQSIA